MNIKLFEGIKSSNLFKPVSDKEAKKRDATGLEEFKKTFKLPKDAENIENTLHVFNMSDDGSEDLFTSDVDEAAKFAQELIDQGATQVRISHDQYDTESDSYVQEDEYVWVYGGDSTNDSDDSAIDKENEVTEAKKRAAKGKAKKAAKKAKKVKKEVQAEVSAIIPKELLSQDADMKLNELGAVMARGDNEAFKFDFIKGSEKSVKEVLKDIFGEEASKIKVIKAEIKAKELEPKSTIELMKKVLSESDAKKIKATFSREGDFNDIYKDESGRELAYVDGWLYTINDIEEPVSQVGVLDDSTPVPQEKTKAGRDLSNKYMMLDMLRSRCEYALNWGKNSDTLEKKDGVVSIIKRMKDLYNELPEKPEWLSEEEINKYEKDLMARAEGKDPVKEAKSDSSEFDQDKVIELMKDMGWGDAVVDNMEDFDAYVVKHMHSKIFNSERAYANAFDNYMQLLSSGQIDATGDVPSEEDVNEAKKNKEFRRDIDKAKRMIDAKSTDAGQAGIEVGVRWEFSKPFKIKQGDVKDRSLIGKHAVIVTRVSSKGDTDKVAVAATADQAMEKAKAYAEDNMFKR